MGVGAYNLLADSLRAEAKAEELSRYAVENLAKRIHALNTTLNPIVEYNALYGNPIIAPLKALPAVKYRLKADARSECGAEVGASDGCVA